MALPSLAAPMIASTALGVAGGFLGSGRKRSSTTIDVKGTRAQQVSEEEIIRGLESLQREQAGLRGLTLPRQQRLLSAFEQAASGGGLPGQQDLASAQQFGAQLFAARRTAFDQLLQQAEQRQGAQAARLGRASTDPVLQGRLRASQRELASQEALQQQSLLMDLANQAQRQRLGFLGSAAQQAQQMELGRLGLFQSQLGQERNFMLASAGTTTTGAKPGFADKLGAGLGIAGGALGAFGGFQKSMAQANLANRTNVGGGTSSGSGFTAAMR